MLVSENVLKWALRFYPPLLFQRIWVIRFTKGFRGVRVKVNRSLINNNYNNSIFGGTIMGLFFAGINPEEYVRHIPSLVNWFSVFSGLFKCSAFAFVLATICTYKGYTATGGAKGVGRAVVIRLQPAADRIGQHLLDHAAREEPV